MLDDRNNPPTVDPLRLDEPIEPRSRHQVGNHGVYEGPHWGWFVGVFVLLLLGLVAIGLGEGDHTRTAMNERASMATTGSAPVR